MLKLKEKYIENSIEKVKRLSIETRCKNIIEFVNNITIID